MLPTALALVFAAHLSLFPLYLVRQRLLQRLWSRSEPATGQPLDFAASGGLERAPRCMPTCDMQPAWGRPATCRLRRASAVSGRRHVGVVGQHLWLHPGAHKRSRAPGVRLSMFAQRADDLTPNMGLWWYFFAEMFEHFRAFFLFVFHIQPALLLLPLTLRLRGKPMVLTLLACLLTTLFKVRKLLG